MPHWDTPCRVGYHAAWDGIPALVGYHLLWRRYMEASVELLAAQRSVIHSNATGDADGSSAAAAAHAALRTPPPLGSADVQEAHGSSPFWRSAEAGSEYWRKFASLERRDVCWFLFANPEVCDILGYTRTPVGDEVAPAPDDDDPEQ